MFDFIYIKVDNSSFLLKITFLNELIISIAFLLNILLTQGRANTPELGLFNIQRPHTDRIKPHTILNDETSAIERDLYAFGATMGGGGVTLLVSNSSAQGYV